MSHDHSDPQHQLPARRSAPLNTAISPFVRRTESPIPIANENLISPAFMIWVLRQWWVIVVPAGLLLAAAAGAIVMATYTPKYEATALLMIEDVTPFVAFSDR